MKEHPTLFNTEMVRVILTCAKCGNISVAFPCSYCGSEYFLKTQTRRVANKKFWPIFKESERVNGKICLTMLDWDITCPYGQVGDLLWVKENIFIHSSFAGMTQISYLASENSHRNFDFEIDFKRNFRPAFLMPKWAARIWLEVTGSGAERLQEITSGDAAREGIEQWGTDAQMKGKFLRLWDSLNAKRGYSWESNPYVWVTSFKRISAKAGG